MSGAAGEDWGAATAEERAVSKIPGAYLLTVGEETAVIMGSDPQGAYYGAVSFLQLLEGLGPGRAAFACGTIIDRPYHGYRGMRATFPRGTPRPNEMTHAQFKSFLRLLSYLKLNHVWVQGTSWCLPLRRHPEMAWNDVLTFEQAEAFDRYGSNLFLSMDGSLDWSWLYYGYTHLAELYPDETWERMRPEVKKKSRVNPNPCLEETWTVLFETMEDVMAVLSGNHFAIPLDEMQQEQHGSRWGVSRACAGKDPVELWADFAKRLAERVIENGKIPIMSGGMLIREHQGWYRNIYKAVDRIDNRSRILIYNWSEGIVREGVVRLGGKRLQDPELSTTDFFREHGYKDVMHLLLGRWQRGTELREARGKLDCYGGFVSYYHPMTYDTMKDKGTLTSLVFTAQHLWSPDQPPMDSDQDLRQCRYGEALADAVMRGLPFIDAVREARHQTGSDGKREFP